jgi:deazaflavin-dependent oxidoreductase (nitroreductase family)
VGILTLAGVNENGRELKNLIPSTLRKEVHMPTQNDTLKARLSRSREITIAVTGRKSGRTISIPVWFVLEDDKLYLLPVQGSDTQWYKNVLKNPTIRIKAGGAEAELKVIPITDHKQVSSVVEKFRAKYGASDVKKYYSKFDVSVVAQMPSVRS